MQSRKLGVARADEGAPFEHPFEPRAVDEETFVSVLRRAVSALDAAGIDYAAIGGIASGLLGRRRWTRDLDLFLKDRHDAERALDALRDAGFAVERTDDNWL